MVKDHLSWIATALILALAGEGSKAMLVDAVGHSIFTNPLLMVIYTALGYVFSIFYDSKSKRPSHKPPIKRK